MLYVVVLVVCLRGGGLVLRKRSSNPTQLLHTLTVWTVKAWEIQLDTNLKVKS